MLRIATPKIFEMAANCIGMLEGKETERYNL